jgi:NADPH2:quinone reductase
VSNAAKEQAARDAGAHEVIRYTEADFVSEVGKLTGGKGVDVVYDGVGPATFDGSVAALRPGGTLLHYGQPSGGMVPPVDTPSIDQIRPTLPDFIATRDALLTRAGDVFTWVRTGAVTLHKGQQYPLADAAAAHTDLEQRRSIGKLLLAP